MIMGGEKGGAQEGGHVEVETRTIRKDKIRREN